MMCSGRAPSNPLKRQKCHGERCVCVCVRGRGVEGGGTSPRRSPLRAGYAEWKSEITTGVRQKGARERDCSLAG